MSDRFTHPHQTAGEWPGEPGMGGWYTEEELLALQEVFQCLRSSWAKAYRRTYQERFEAEFAAYVGLPHAIAVNSGGVALDLAIACIEADPGDEVISCAINFVGAHLAVLGRGLRLVLGEPNPATLNLEPSEIPRRMTRRTRAILVTHMNGLPADMAAIESAARDRAQELGIPPPRIIVDAARAAGAATPSGRVGKQGWITIFSFHRKKCMTTLGEGGMLVTASESAAQRLRDMRSIGNWDVWGSSYRMTEFQAAVGSVQLRRLDEMNHCRIRLAHARSRILGDVARLQVPPEPPGFRHVFSLYNLLLPPGARPGDRDRLMGRLQNFHDVGAVVANPPTYQSHRLIHDHVVSQGPFPIADDVGDRLLCPTLHPLMTEEENTLIAEAISESVFTEDCECR
jgi:perosamine synthetase